MKLNDGLNDRRISEGEESLGFEWDNNPYMTDVQYRYESSICDSSSDEEDSNRLSPVMDDANS